MDETLYQSLAHKFDIDPKEAVNEAQIEICKKRFPSFDVFVSSMRENQHSCACQTSWPHGGLGIRCLDCQTSKYSIICIPCYLNGNHRNHRCYLSRVEIGNCDCGDPSSWKQDGFCVHHKLPEKDPDTQLDPLIRTRLLSVFAASLRNLPFLASFDPRGFLSQLKWVSSFLSIADSVTRCVSISMEQYFDLSDFLLQTCVHSSDAVSAIFDFFGQLFNDDYFQMYFGKVGLHIFSKVQRLLFKASALYRNDENRAPLKQICLVMRNLFRCFESRVLNKAIEEPILNESIGERFDWVAMLSESTLLAVSYLMRECSTAFFELTMINTIFANFDLLLSTFLARGDQEAEFRRFAVKFATIISPMEGAFPVTRAIGEKENDLINTQAAVHSLVWVLGHVTAKIVKANVYESSVVTSLFAFVKDMLLDDQFDADSGNIIFFRCPMMPGVRMSLSLSLHILAWSVLHAQKDQLKATFSHECDTVSMSPDDMCLFVAVLPIRLWTVSVQSSLGFWVRNDQSFINAVSSSLFYKQNLKLAGLPLFSLIQAMLGFTDQKDTYVSMIGHNAGLFDGFDVTTYKQLEFFFIYFMACLIFDRACILKDKPEIMRRLFMTVLMKDNLKLSDVSRYWWKDNIDRTPMFERVMSSFAQRVHTSQGLVFKMVNDSDWNPLVPWAYVQQSRDAIAVYLTKHPKSLLCFPDFVEPPYEIDLVPVLTTSVLLAVEFQVLYNQAYSQSSSMIETVHLVLNLLIKTVELTNTVITVPEEIPAAIVAGNLEELVDSIPDFEDFFHAPIEYKGNAAATVIQLIELLGHIGIETLKKIHVLTITPPSTPTDAHKQQLAKAARERVQQRILHKTKMFQSTDLCTSEDICEICKFDLEGRIGFPALAFQSILPQFASDRCHNEKSVINESVTSFQICTHCFHQQCWNDSACPLDRSVRNCLLPRIESLGTLGDDEYDDIRQFFATAFPAGTQGIVTSIAGEVIVNEINARARLDTLNRQNFTFLIKYLFNAAWHFFHHENALPPNLNHEPFESLLLQFFQLPADTESLRSSFLSMATANSSHLDQSLTLEYFRRCTIFDRCIFGPRSTETKSTSASEFIDWDVLLDPQQLSQYFTSHVVPIKLRDFSFIDLPPMFLELIQEPYNLNIDDITATIAVDLLTGAQVVIGTAPTTCPFPQWNIHLNDNLGHAASVFLVITGKETGSVFFASSSMEVNGRFRTKEIYLDANGDTDIGYERGELLYLSKSRLDWLLNFYLTGEWTDLSVVRD